ncbi:MAG: LamG domain-containing protein [Planctomycetes bacterium]|nr:LamG domain-containing protein [Planctomycetota bacterium]
MRSRCRHFAALTFIIPLTLCSAALAEPVFRAGAYAMDISPRHFPVLVNGGFLESSADQVNDPVYAKCLVLDDGSVQVAVAVVDSCMLPRDLLDAAKRMAHDQTGIPPERMLISATHTHSAPSAMGALGCPADADYVEFLPDRIAAGIERAFQDLRPARLGWGSVKAREHTRCRRWILRSDKCRADPFGAVNVRATMHPGYQNPDFIGPSGPVDPELSVLSIQTPEGRPLALLANYSMHYFGASPVSADYFGRFAVKLKRLLGAEGADPAFVAMMSQGTSGDQQWMDYGQPEKNPGLEVYAGALALAAFEACRKIEHRDWAPLDMAEAKLTLRRREPDEARLAWARRLISSMQAAKPKNIPEVYALEQVFLHDDPVRELKLQALRLGDLGIAAIPDEVFALTGLKIKAQSPFPATFVIELANGSEGYIPPPEQHQLGGYTTWPARTAALEAEAEPRIVETVLALLEKVSRRPRRPAPFVPTAASQAILNSKPAAYFPLDEWGGATAFDRSGLDNHGAFEPGLAFYLEGAPLPEQDALGRAVHFAGGRLKAAIPDFPESYSVEMWFWNGFPNEARVVAGYLFSRGPGGAAGAPGEHLGIGGTGTSPGRLFLFNGNQRGQTLVGKTEIKPRTWHHVALAREGKKVRLHLDGGLEPEIAGELEAGASPPSSQLFFGGRSDNYANFEGKIDDAAVYPRALIPQEIAAHHQARASHRP